MTHNDNISSSITMKPFKAFSSFIFYKSLVLLLLVCYSAQSSGQATSKEKMAQLFFMVGDWEGISTSFKEEGDTQVMAHEVVRYKVDGHLITLDLESETLTLHTVIYFDEKEQTYYYCPFYKTGTGKYKGSYADNQFLVSFNERKRLVFQRTPEGCFHEYGEQLKDGKWVKYFEDILPPKQN